MSISTRFPVRAWSGVLAAGLLAHLVLALGTDHHLWAQRLMAALCLLAAGAAVTKAVSDRTLLWSTLALGVSTWALGDVYYTTFVTGHPGTQFPTVADGLWLASYVPLYAAIIQVVRASVAGTHRSLWLDGLLAALTAAAVAAAIVLPLLDLGDGHGRAVLVTLAYPLCDLVLLGGVAGGWVLTHGASARTWRLLAAGLVVLAVTDMVFAARVAAGGYVSGVWTDAGWPLALALLAGACWTPVEHEERRPDRSRRMPIVPVVCAVIATTLLLVDHFERVHPVTLALAGAAMLVSILRTVAAFIAVSRLQDSAAQAMTDELTGLSNRRRLLADLEAVASGAPAPATLALFDLDGFKTYNDAYGHPAGDGLLVTVAQRLRRAVDGHGSAYRLGGDEFCVLIGSDVLDHALVLDRAVEALRQDGHGFSIGASYGAVTVPGEASSGAAALQLADTRMYARKDARRGSTRRQSRDLLLQLLHEQQPDLEEHSGDVGELVVGVGRRMGLGEEALDHARHGAELHDVGKVAVPAAILAKPGPLNDDEWALMKRHTVIGERILSAVPALVPVGRIVRSTHERWDGGGYPDGLRGDDIPLAARIIAVCDAFHAITTDRPYRAGRTEEEALAELRSCAGTQFDPVVVDQFAAELADGGAQGLGASTGAPAGDGDVARRVLPAGAIAQSAAGELAQIAQLRGLLHAIHLARGGAEVTEVLESIAHTIASSLGFRVVSINLFRPEWDEFVNAAVEGEPAVRERLHGKAVPATAWRPLLDERFARAGAYFVPAGAVEFDDDVTYHVPAFAPLDDPGAWHPDDMLLVPLVGSDGDVVGMVSVDEPVWGRRPSDAEIEVLVAVAEHAALAVQSARSAGLVRDVRRAQERAGALAADLVGALTPGEVAAAVEACMREAFGFGVVAVELVTSPDAARELDALLADADEQLGTRLLCGEAADRARAWRGVGGSTRNGRGRRAWNDHLIAAPVRGVDDELLAVLWCDDPDDRLLPHSGVLRALRVIAAQAGVALAWGRRLPAPQLSAEVV